MEFFDHELSYFYKLIIILIVFTLQIELFLEVKTLIIIFYLYNLPLH